MSDIIIKNLGKYLRTPKFLDYLYDGLDHTNNISNVLNYDAKYIMYYYISRDLLNYNEIFAAVKNDDEEVCKKIESIWKRKIKSLSKGYIFDKSIALKKLMSNIVSNVEANLKCECDDMNHPYYIEIKKNIMEIALNKYVENVGIDEVYERLCDGKYNSEMDYELNKPFKIVDRKYVSAKEAGQPSHSIIVSSSFNQYYYYNTIVKVDDENMISFLETRSIFVSAWWN